MMPAKLFDFLSDRRARERVLKGIGILVSVGGALMLLVLVLAMLSR